MANFSLNGIDIKNPSGFKIERYFVTNMQRLANADMVGDLIAKKRKFYFTYEALSGYDLDTILDILWNTNNLFHTLSYIYNGVVSSATVYVGSIPTELHRAGRTTNWIWRNVTFNLIEK
jgi:hypothetical protein